MAALQFTTNRDWSECWAMLAAAAAFVGLGIGVMRKSRIGAVSVLVLFVCVAWSRARQGAGIEGPTEWLPVALGAPLLCGVLGTFAHPPARRAAAALQR